MVDFYFLILAGNKKHDYSAIAFFSVSPPLMLFYSLITLFFKNAQATPSGAKKSVAKDAPFLLLFQNKFS
jgi:hypothetical protein